MILREDILEEKNLEIPFYKLHLGGHDFVLLNFAADDTPSEQRHDAIARQVCRRNTGVGAAGVIFLYRQETGTHRFFIHSLTGAWKIALADAAFCVCRYLFDSGLMNQETTILLADDREIAVRVIDSRHFSFSLGKPRTLEGEELLEKSDTEYGQTITIGNRYFTFTPLLLHYPALIHFTSQLSDSELHPLFNTLVSERPIERPAQPIFVQVNSHTEIVVRTWYKRYREADYTTTAAQALVASVVNGFAERRCRVRCRDGELVVQWNKQDGLVTVAGTAEYIFTGTLYLDSESGVEFS